MYREAVYALVAYLPGKLGRFIDHVKKELHPWGAPGRSHVTVLPPRPLNGNARAALDGITRSAGALRPIEVEAAHLDVFLDTNVIYVSVAVGFDELRGIHRALNAGDAHFQEPFPFHPHITLAVGVPPEEVPAIRKKAESLWAGYAGSKAFTIECLSFVQTRNGEDWADLGRLHLRGSSDGKGGGRSGCHQRTGMVSS